MIPLSTRDFSKFVGISTTQVIHTQKFFLLIFTSTFPYQYLTNTYINANKKNNTIFPVKTVLQWPALLRGMSKGTWDPSKTAWIPWSCVRFMYHCLSHLLHLLPAQFGHLSTHYFVFFSNYLQCLWCLSSCQSNCF